jgi:NitT/TauT family transport system substrate-binding protein
MKKRALSSLLAIGMAVTLAACGSGSGAKASSTASSTPAVSTDTSSAEDTAETAETEPAEASTESTAAAQNYDPVTVRVAYMPNLGSADSLFIGIDQGYFAEYGITVEPSEFQGGPAEITAMASGDIDIAQIGHGAHALCIEGQAKIFQMDHTTSLSDEVVANKSHGIEKAEDLKGKTIAVASGTSSEIILQQVLAKAGLKDSDVKLVEMSVDGMTTAMIANQIDACATWSPNTVTLKNSLGDNYLSLGGNADFLDTAIFPSSYITTDKYASANKDVLVRFAAALDKAHDYRAAHIEDSAKALAKHLDAPEETMLASTKEGDWDTITKIAGDMDAIKKVYETQQNVFIANGRIKEKVDTNDYVLYDVMKEGYDLYSSTK